MKSWPILFVGGALLAAAGCRVPPAIALLEQENRDLEDRVYQLADLVDQYRCENEALKQRFYALTGLNSEGLPKRDWHRELSQLVTGFAVEVDLPAETPGVPEHALIIDEPIENVVALREVLARRLPEAASQLADPSLNVAVNDELLIASEREARVANGDRVTLMPMLGGG